MNVANAERCPFCSGTRLNAFRRAAHDAAPGSGQTVSVVECLDCVAAWQFPLARNADESRETFDAAYAAGDGYFDPEKRRAVSDLQRQFIEARMPVGEVLDVGCGDGRFVRTMAEAGWHATGLDPAMPEKAADEAGYDTLQLIRGTLADLPASRVFDVVTLWDVVEHLENPLQVLSAVAARVRPGGSLILETGNYQSAGRIEGDEQWWNYQLDHRWYFAPPQLETLVRAVGLEPIGWAPRVLRPWWHGNAHSPAPRLRSLVKAMARGPAAFNRATRRHQQLTVAHRDWATWGGLEIVTLQARRPA